MANWFHKRKRSVLLYTIMLIFSCFIIFAIFNANIIVVDSAARQQFRTSRQDPNKIVKLVHTVFRHGPRTPADTYPTDPHINETFSPFGWGHITNNGKKFLYETGKWLKMRYGKFLGKNYVPEAVYAQTTGITRTFMSMATVLAGLFPPRNTDMEWSTALNWQPVPIYSQPLEEDDLLLVRVPCTRYYEALKEVFDTKELKNVLAENKQLFDELTEFTGHDIKTPDDVNSLYSTLLAEEEYGLELPEWTKNYYPDRLLPLSEKSYIYNAYTEELQRIKAGPFVKKMVGEWLAKRDGILKPDQQKIYLYTGHDSTIVNILHALKVWEQQFPVYGIMAIFELVEDKLTGEYGVQIYLRNNPRTGAIPLTIPGCKHFCPLDKFIELSQNLLSVNLPIDCKPKDSSFTTPPPSGP